MTDRSRMNDDRVLLEGPRSRSSELLRALRIFAEVVRGFRKLHFVGPTTRRGAWAARSRAPALR
jgi:hypothetical protein